MTGFSYKPEYLADQRRRIVRHLAERPRRPNELTRQAVYPALLPVRSLRGWLGSRAVDQSLGIQPPPGLTGPDGFEQHRWKLFLSMQGYMRNPPLDSDSGTSGGSVWAQLRRAGSDRGQCRRAAERLCVLTRHRLLPLDIAAVVGMSLQGISEIRVPPDTPMSGAERRKCLTALSPVRDDWI